MSMDDKKIVGETFEDLSDREMTMLIGRGNEDVAPPRLRFSALRLPR